MTPSVRIYVVTYRRPQLLMRALRSLVAQTRPDWVAEVLNDDPEDGRVADVVRALSDPRIRLSEPPRHRGGTANFNHAFRSVPEPLASILEDDNWWEPSFLATVMAALEDHPSVVLACANERIWFEEPDGTWRRSEQTIWPPSDRTELFHLRVADKCGRAKLCNSALLFRTRGSEAWQTPDSIPIDVTEHFRERVIPHPFLLVNTPLVNYAETLRTHRSRSAAVWGSYQVLLVGSVFAVLAADQRQTLASQLWMRARTNEPPFATTLLATSLAVPDARCLWSAATFRERARFVVGALRHPITSTRIAAARRRHKCEWQWLLQGTFAKAVLGNSIQ